MCSSIITKLLSFLLQHMSTRTTIVIFDGVCALCNSAVDFLLHNDRTASMRFGSFQSENVTQLLQSHNITQAPTTIYVITPANVLLQESSAILFLACLLGGWWKFFSTIAYVVPRPVRDAVYRLVARNRYRWFGKRESCRIPTEAERGRFL